MPDTNYTFEFDEREFATMLAALRLYQSFMEPHADGTQGGRKIITSEETDALGDIATNMGEFDPLQSEDIEALIEQLQSTEDDEVPMKWYHVRPGYLLSDVIFPILVVVWILQYVIDHL